ncbi:class I SAM-dependent methyltransferase [Acidipropionibacterium virtanenii]|uniref:Putative methyltransferase n=1 Tax=Acidipropionibacterium virtanenii TaxID=2057246 RepID=A0A344UWH7_9ACTN|nr:class I SAM-dependent methyltransferase [Acidipropionibacterium virtanenii]AXE39625.1 putative methyltransferase [Acidipropionibacterium virtanenii]
MIEGRISPSDRQARAHSFGEAATDYQRYRPDYPIEAVRHLVAGAPAGGRVLDLGAGTGKLTDRLVALGRELARVMRGARPLGLAWNTDHTDSGWLARIEAIRNVPRGSELNRGPDRTPAAPGPGWLPFTRYDVEWSRTMLKEDFLALWRTHSQWLTATDEQRTEWMSGWREILATDPAVATLDAVSIPMTTECWVTRPGG